VSSGAVPRPSTAGESARRRRRRLEVVHSGWNSPTSGGWNSPPSGRWSSRERERGGYVYPEVGYVNLHIGWRSLGHDQNFLGTANHIGKLQEQVLDDF
jgi:hypothetical protein